jgi:hypothetical protein
MPGEPSTPEICDRPLPTELRETLANANHPWAPSWAHVVMRFGVWPLDVVISRVAIADREEELQREMQLLKGED